ncbi:MAG: pyridoxal phosphate-dependent aminotransferase [Firmicutes bacterium]|nr:pyridoxal phosphate-dependent aminotransferase [Bacillota bacterium]
MQLSDRVQKMQGSPIRKFNPIAIAAEDAGKKIYHLNIGNPDIETPDCYLEAIKKYESPTIGYAESGGDKNLQDAIIDYFKRYDVELERNDILVTNGGSEALSMAFCTTINDGDDVLIPEPYYTNYHTFVTQSGGNVVPVQTSPDNGYEWATEAQLEAAVTPNTKAIVCITPGNPTGRVMTLDEMKVVGEFAKKHDLWIVADEVYREFVFDGAKPTSFSMLEDLKDRVLIIDSISKRYSTCGGRVGILLSRNPEFQAAVMKIAMGRLCVPTLEMIGATELYKLPASYIEGVRDEYEARRNVAYEELMKIPGVVCQKPGGAFYMTIKLPVESAEDLLIFMLEEFEDNGESMMFTPAAGFYATPGKGLNEIRIAYVLCQDDIRRAMELLRLGIEAYKAR